MQPVLPLAETMMSDVSLRFREETVEQGWGTEIFFYLVPVLALLVAAAIYKFYNRPRRAINEPRRLLLQMCQAQRLPRKSLDLVDRISEAAELKQPTVMLVSPELFEATLRRAEAKKPLSARDQDAVAKLRHRLFALEASV